MKTRRKRKKPQIITLLIVLALSFVFAYPFWHTIVLSFSDNAFAYETGFKFWPRKFVLDAYEFVFKDNSIFIGYFNTIWRAAVGTVLTIAATYCAAYAMTEKDLPGWSLITFFITFTMFFSGGTIPSYLNMKELGLIGNRWALVLPRIAGAWNFLIMRNFLMSVDKEIKDAARIDGAGVFQTMIRVYAPLSKSVIAVVGLWSVVGHWNAWFDALLYTNKTELMVLQTVIRRLINYGNDAAQTGELMSMAESTPDTVRAATIVIATFPILFGYPFIQKYLVKGTMVGAVKG